MPNKVHIKIGMKNVILNSTFLPVPWITRFKTKDLSNPLITIQITNTSLPGNTPCQQFIKEK